MTIDVLRQSLTLITKTIENASVSIVRSLKSSTFAVHVDNPQEKVVVSGTVIVGNQKNLEEIAKKSEQARSKDASTAKTATYKVVEQNPVKEIKVTNFKDISHASLQTELINLGKSLLDFKKIVSDKKEISVSNQPISELGAITTQLASIGKLVGKLKLDPKITVQPTPVSIAQPAPVPAPVVNITERELDVNGLAQAVSEALYSKDPKQFLSVRLSDGSSFYEAMKEMMAISSGGGGGRYAYQSESGERGYGRVDENSSVLVSAPAYDLIAIKAGTVTYMAHALPGTLDTEAKWKVQRIDKSVANRTEIRYAGTGKFEHRADDMPSLYA
jgi:hypothetical protein